MSDRWPGGIVRATPVTPAGPYQTDAAPGVWTLDQASYWIKQGLWPTAGNVLTVEDVFSTWLYTGNGSTQTITNGINLSSNGGLVWIKARSAATANVLVDSARGAGFQLSSNTTGISASVPQGVSSLTSSGFTLGTDSFYNATSTTFASWTFREAPKFFDVVAYTGDGSFSQTIPHNLGIAPGMIIVKRLDTTSNWWTYNRGIPGTINGYLNLTDAFSNSGYLNISGSPASSFLAYNFGGNDLNVNGGTYVAYLFAHDTSSTGFIQCGAYSGTGSAGNAVTLGWEPQWVMIKAATAAQGWWIYDNMRGMPVNLNDAALLANSSAAEQSYEAISPTATGFQLMNGNQDTNASGNTYIYVAIRRGPMKTPTVGTTVFSPVTRTGTGATASVTAGFAVDFGISAQLAMSSTTRIGPYSKLQGAGQVMNTNDTVSEVTRANSVTGFTNTGITVGNDAGAGFVNESGQPIINWFFQRAPGFMDEICWTGDGTSSRTLVSNLAAEAQLAIAKCRSNSTTGWKVWMNTAGAFALQSTGAVNNSGDSVSALGSGYVTTTGSSLVTNSGVDYGDGPLGGVNASGRTYVAYLFSTCPGVSKVGTYTGTGALQTINCGFTTGSRFVLIKRSDSTGDWYLWDSARGITSGNDPYMLLNSTAAQVTGTNYVDTVPTGFQVTAAAPAGINANGGTYIFLAVA